ncbi:MAG TPA: rhodanese-like domain-containing protein [Jatrophihabitans sp.]|jgi:thiosulfate/3-mercaptopyruvate sulfurtransferase|uniref:sulfurtransferase n=1 Tax=Jatrophihabitans sp. TaxID=1932789 RepID=UPI002E061098|nr:rhodanese-like domain-containing protein [Jatrophihabitans sp.]
MKTTADDAAREPGSTTRSHHSRTDVLVSPEWLTAHLRDPGLTVVEVDVSSAAYDDWHIDGAVLWNVYSDLKDRNYRLVPPTALESLLARSGIGPGSTVVFYGYAPAMGFWLMSLLGHSQVRILDCSRDTWRAEGHPWGDVVPQPLETRYRLRAGEARVRADLAAVRDAIGRPEVVLLDVRTAAEFDGDRFWPSGAPEPHGRAGHVPTAVHQTIDAIHDHRGAFRPDAELREHFAPHLGPDRDLITYCAVGGRAATAWFVLTHLLGHDHVRVYDGSWAEWGRLPGTPVAISESAHA